MVATAATVAAVAALGGSPQNSAQDPGPAASQTPTEDSAPSEASEPTQQPEPTEETTPPEQPASASATLPAYYLRETPQGLRLTREFQRVDLSDGPVTEAVRLALTGRALDPDYRTVWPAGSDAKSVSVDGGTINVDLTGASQGRPSGMSAEQAELAIQQVVYTAQAAAAQGRLPVQLTLDGASTAQVLGISTSEPFSNAAENETLALVSVSSLSEGETVDDRFVVSGIANSFEATVPWEVRQGDRVVAKGFATADGWMDKLYPWTTQVDVSKLAPGTYTFAAMTDDPSGGAEGAGPTEDTKTIVVK